MSLSASSPDMREKKSSVKACLNWDVLKEIGLMSRNKVVQLPIPAESSSSQQKVEARSSARNNKIAAGKCNEITVADCVRWNTGSWPTKLDGQKLVKPEISEIKSPSFYHEPSHSIQRRPGMCCWRSFVKIENKNKFQLTENNVKQSDTTFSSSAVIRTLPFCHRPASRETMKDNVAGCVNWEFPQKNYDPKSKKGFKPFKISRHYT